MATRRTGAALLAAALLVIVGVGVLVAWRPWQSEETPAARPSETAGPGEVTVLAAGDIGRCNEDGDEATAEIVASNPDATVLALGDIAYDDGTAEDFAECYDPSWGPFLERTRPVPGNHEYRTDDGDPYYDYFGEAAGEPGKGWYSFNLGKWHVIALNSNCEDVGCDEGSEQEEWLRADLEANDARCTLAFWHEPRFSSGERHGGTQDVRDFWRVLMEYDVEVVLSGHEHLYERTAQLNARGDLDPEEGILQFVVGTGGGNLYDLGAPIPGSEAALEGTNGVLKMALRPDGYDWEFLAVDSDEPADTGTDTCR